MNEISTQSSQLEAYEKVIEIEEAENEKKIKEKNIDTLLSQKNTSDMFEEQHQEDQARLREEAVRKSLVQDVINEAKDNGTSIPPAVLKLMNHYKGKCIFISVVCIITLFFSFLLALVICTKIFIFTLFFSFLLASLNSLIWNVRDIQHTLKAVHRDSEANKLQNDLIIQLLKEQRGDSRKMETILQTKVPDLSQYFPLKDSAALERFLDDKDGQYKLRASEFYNLLRCCITDKKNKFSTAILKTFFSPEYIATHSWPTTRYNIVILLNQYLLPFSFY